ncbi:hypothetical protein SDC9_176223 [bioreactor metagenome]|uniref:Radical SAM core domain-containing protein n=1 Tax=bioreactor metagenome TaxID=1076179 RepID=A0A645GPD5_9ZZZZ
MTITYTHENTIYVNVTNKCSNCCAFCIRNNKDNIDESGSLWLEREPTKEEILQDILQRDLTKYDELCFCGFGEPTYRIEDILWVSKEIKSHSEIPIRINTNGHANLIHGRDVAPLMDGLIDTVSISLNAKNAEWYHELCRSQFGLKAFDGLLDFAKKAKPYVKRVVLTVVDVLPQADVDECKKIAKDIGVDFRVRHFEQ